MTTAELVRRAGELVARDEDPELVCRLLESEFAVSTERARHAVLAAQVRLFTRLAHDTAPADRSTSAGTREPVDDIIPGFGIGSPLAALRVVTEGT
jgi:hypothetical protein